MSHPSSLRRLWPATWGVIILALIGAIAIPVAFAKQGASGVLVGITTFLLVALAASVLSTIAYMISGRSLRALNIAVVVVFAGFIIFLAWAIAARSQV